MGTTPIRSFRFSSDVKTPTHNWKAKVIYQERLSDHAWEELQRMGAKAVKGKTIDTPERKRAKPENTSLPTAEE